jgi:hypothetical protein
VSDFPRCQFIILARKDEPTPDFPEKTNRHRISEKTNRHRISPNSTGAHRISEATRSSISPATASTSGASKKAERAFMQLAHFSQPKMEAPLPTRALLTIETTKEIGNRSAFSTNETKKETVLSRSGGTRQ